MDLAIKDICKAEVSENGCVTYWCLMCSKTYDKATAFSKHMKVGHSAVVYACRKCDNLFPKLGLLFLHCRDYHSKKKFQPKKIQCGLCQYSTDNGGLFKYHLRAHTGKKPEICDICETGFSQKSNMKVHRKRHFKPTVDFYCFECDTTYGSHDILLAHIGTKEHKLIYFINQTLNVNVTFNCQICNLTSDNIDEVMDHGKRCFCNNHLACQTCFNKFPLNKTKLREHRKLHREELLLCWECAENSERFTSKASLIIHLTKEHGIDFQKSYVCRYCEGIFESKAGLAEHIEIEHLGQKYRHLPNDNIGRLQCDHPDCQFFTNSFMQLAKHCKIAHNISNETEMMKTEKTVSYVPNDTVKITQRGRPRLCDSNVKLSKPEEISIFFAPVVGKKRGRPKHEVKEDVDYVPKKRGRPRKYAEPEIVEDLT